MPGDFEFGIQKNPPNFGEWGIKEFRLGAGMHAPRGGEEHGQQFLVARLNCLLRVMQIEGTGDRR